MAADTTLTPYPTEDLLDRYGRDRPRLRRSVGREVPIDLTLARTLLGFRVEHLLDIEPAPLPAQPDLLAVHGSAVVLRGYGTVQNGRTRHLSGSASGPGRVAPLRWSRSRL